MKRLIILTMFIVFMFSSLALAGEKTLRFTWEHDTINLAGFRLLMSEVSGDYSNATGINIPYDGTSTEFLSNQVITSPDNETHTYYFVLYAYDDEMNFSNGHSNEVSAEIDFEGPSVPFSLTVTVSSQ